MTRRGRKRKQVVRTGNGRVTRAGEPDVRAVALSQPHRRWLPERLRKDQRAGNALGRLYLAGILTEGQTVAGEKFRRLMLEYSAIIDAPRLLPTLMARMIAEKADQKATAEIGADAVSTSHFPMTEVERCYQVLGIVSRVRSMIRKQDITGSVWRDLNAVVMEDQEPRDIVNLIVGLHVLAALWRTFDDGYRPIRATGDAENSWEHEERAIMIKYA